MASDEQNPSIDQVSNKIEGNVKSNVGSHTNKGGLHGTSSSALGPSSIANQNQHTGSKEPTNSNIKSNNTNLLASSPRLHGALSRSPYSNYGSVEQSDDKKLERVNKYLPTPNDPAHTAQGSSAINLSTSPYQLPVSEVAHDVFKWRNEIENEPLKRGRSKSMYIPATEQDDPLLSNIKQPGGFRRHYVKMKAQQEGKRPPNFITENFIDFLDMYGHFAGEYLSDDEDEFETSTLASYDNISPDEAESLIPEAGAGASASKAVFLLLKAFVGTGVMFLPKAFSNGGMIFSSLFLVAIAGISLFAFLLLTETRQKIYPPSSFGEIGGILYGNWMRYAVLFSVTVSQIGFVCAYMIFVGENLKAFTENALLYTVELKIFLLFQVMCFIPLAMIRRISKLSWTAIVADLFIMFGLLVLYFYDIKTLSDKGLGKIKYFNSETYSLFIGTAVFTYEGIGLIIPIAEAMKKPQKFPQVLTGVMIGITLLFTSVGVLSYAAFGDSVKPVVILSLPSDSRVVQGVQLLYALAILLSIPLQLFPAIRIMEQGLFTRSGKMEPLVKWQKNTFRTLMVIVCALISFGGAQDLDKFVALIGSFACIPLCFIYPPLFHFKVADTYKAKFLDIALLIFGIITCLYTTYITLSIWIQNTGDVED